jgi:predicted esterase
MHGFTDNAKNYAETLLPMLSAELGSSEQPPDAHVRFVFLQAPQRRISCYGEPRQRHAAWHDYFTDHGGEEGKPELEEELDTAHLEWTRRQVHRVLDVEAARLSGHTSRLVLLGQSQGSCCAIDAALTYKECLGGLFCSIGQLYSVTPAPAPGREALRIVTFNGAADQVIGAGLALRSYARLLELGFCQVSATDDL